MKLPRVNDEDGWDALEDTIDDCPVDHIECNEINRPCPSCGYNPKG